MIINPWWDDHELPADFAAMTDIIRSAAAAANIALLDTEEPLSRRTELISGDGAVADEAGHRVLADAVIAAMDSVLATS
ncbi:hypothetical protein [Nakamurella leprariae]|uniref:Uncharacterized protein n=1 Tax=Nakamurella leprariae TaxID=2803911 RepID=A0A939BY23_9ACTN|nr:hypothetical protein [Nakamurella leprariae]MBM9469133.1 hypothetical protein [Nakamurella leprariae]